MKIAFSLFGGLRIPIFFIFSPKTGTLQKAPMVIVGIQLSSLSCSQPTAKEKVVALDSQMHLTPAQPV